MQLILCFNDMVQNLYANDYDSETEIDLSILICRLLKLNRLWWDSDGLNIFKIAQLIHVVGQSRFQGIRLVRYSCQYCFGISDLRKANLAGI